jgi:histidine triad (HIT) family protein
MVRSQVSPALRGEGRFFDVSEDCIFCRIAAGEIPAGIIHETPGTVAFRDLRPKAPVHTLVITRAHHADMAALAAADPALAGELLGAAAETARAEGVGDSGYRLIFNSGPDSGQEVPHVHAHVMGGKQLGAMLCAHD